MPGKWHNEIQSFFPRSQHEQYSEDKKNRADVLNSGHKLVLEIQDSYCQNCLDKSNAWKARGYEIIWLFNGMKAETDPCLDMKFCEKILTITKKISELIVFIYVDENHVFPIQTKNFKPS